MDSVDSTVINISQHHEAFRRAVALINATPDSRLEFLEDDPRVRGVLPLASGTLRYSQSARADVREALLQAARDEDGRADRAVGVAYRQIFEGLAAQVRLTPLSA